MKNTTAQWVAKAEADHQFARAEAQTDRRFDDQRCFLSQQSAEKYLKALLAEVGDPIPRTHVLRDLLVLLRPRYKSLNRLGRGLDFLTRFAVAVRYPGENATRRQSKAALKWAERVRMECRTLLRLKVE